MDTAPELSFFKILTRRAQKIRHQWPRTRVKPNNQQCILPLRASPLTARLSWRVFI